MSDKNMPTQSPAAPERFDEKRDPNRIISQKLKALYAAVEQEGIPDRFLSLLEKLDEAERSQKRGGGNE